MDDSEELPPELARFVEMAVQMREQAMREDADALLDQMRMLTALAPNLAPRLVMAALLAAYEAGWRRGTIDDPRDSLLRDAFDAYTEP